VKLETDNGKQAFTLMELLVVMSIMLIISTILVAGYFGMTRAASYTAAETDVFNHLQLARQRASLDGTRVFFMLIDSNSYVLVHGVGELTSDMQNGTFDAFHRFYDAYADLNIPNIKNSRVRVWNMDKNVYGNDAKTLMVTNNSVPTFPGSADKFSHISYSLDIKLPLASQYSQWKKGDRYGFELYPQLVLPKGFLFGLQDLDTTPANDSIVFAADGTSSRVSGSPPVETKTGETKIYIYEKIAKDKQRAVLIKIKNPDGTISVEPL
jgi:prepilin-type N-terminal cleavage/methylation domain-containing protein